MSNTSKPLKLPQSEYLAAALERSLRKYVEDHQGRFLRDAEDGSLHTVLGVRRIPLNYDRDNLQLAKLMIESCGVTTLSAGAQAAIQRFQVYAGHRADRVQMRRFAALSPDGQRLYLPLADGQLLEITAEGPGPVANGENADGLWVEHPSGDALQYAPGNVSAGLGHFERLLVEPQACRVPDMRWFVAMHEGFFPYVRDTCPARLMVVHKGSHQQGKTSGAQRFTLLHGLGEVKGDYTPAALASEGDIGLLVMDNREQANLTQPLIDFLLFLSTGAQRGRATVDGRLRTGDRHRPAAVLTTIEGVWKPELQSRCVEVDYAVTGGKIPRAPIEEEIQRRRHEIRSAMVAVLASYLRLRREARPRPNPVPDFEEHFSALCALLRAYGEVRGKPEEWAELIIDKWADVLTQREVDEAELEQPLLRIFQEWPLPNGIEEQPITYEGKAGTLYHTNCDALLTCLQRLNLRDRTLPKNARGLSSRLRSSTFSALKFLDTDTPNVPVLKRTGNKRPIGFFMQE